MNSPIKKLPPLVISFPTGLVVFLFLALALLLNACGGKLVKETVAETKVQSKGADLVPRVFPIGWAIPSATFTAPGPEPGTI